MLAALLSVAVLGVLAVGCAKQEPVTPAPPAPLAEADAPITPAVDSDATPTTADPESDATPTTANPESDAAPAGEGIEWIHSFSEGVKKAQAEGKPVMMDLYADWCGPCKMLDTNTWPDSEVVALSRKFVCIKVDVDRDQATAQRFRVSSIPMIAFILPDGTDVTIPPGYRGPQDMAREMQKILDKAG